MSKRIDLRAMSQPEKKSLIHLDKEDLSPLPLPLSDPAHTPAWKPLSEQIRGKCECLLDDTCAVAIPKPKTPEEEAALVGKFVSGLEKLFTRENNWTFLQPLLLTMEHCARCQTCSDACHIFEASGNNELYRPTYRSEIVRRLYRKYVKGGGLLSAWQHGDIRLNWPLVARLIELSYRCNLCRRCAQTCPHRRRQRPRRSRIAEAVQPGNGHRRQRDPRKRLHAAAEGRLFDRNECRRGQGQYRVHRRRHDREDRHRSEDAVGRRRRRRAADPQRRRDHGLARESRRLCPDSQRGRNPLDSVLGNRGLRFHQLRPVVRRCAVRTRRRQARRSRTQAARQEDRARANAAMRTRHSRSSPTAC